MDQETSAYEEAKRAARAALRARLLQVAGERLEAAGLEALSMRPLARAAGCSTMVFYTEFGSKEGLLEALSDELTARLLEAVETVADIDLGVHRAAVATAFLDTVAAMPEGYRVTVRPTSTASIAADQGRERQRSLDERLVAALRPITNDQPSHEVARGVVLAMRGAAEGLVMGLAERDELLPPLLALVRVSAEQDGNERAV